MQPFDLDRIRRMNDLYETVLNDIKRQPEETDCKQLGAFIDSLRSKVVMLESYYTSGDWLADFEADEAGLLPEDMKRGVLSEDGLSDLLDAFRDFEHKLENPKPIEEVYGPPSWFL